jgi:TPR repeat protein/DNA-binding transcriptional regulator GbsR (MarR family)
MANKLFAPGFQFYQSANADAEKVKENFLIRLNEFNIIIDDIRRQPKQGSVQHFLLIGRRGSGKSTLLKRLQIELETDVELTQRFIAINLAEEQANIYKLYDLLEAVVDELNYHDIEVESPAWEDDTQQYARDLFAAIHKALDKAGRKLVFLLDNIDRIFENLDEDASLLREYLLNYDDLKIIGGSTKMTEHFWKHNKPFYQFFRVLELNKLTSEEIKTLLLNWSERLNLPELKDFVHKKPGQLETVRLLTDGLPRTLQFFVNILLTRTQETGYEYLRLIMDNVTPLYQERLNSLPPSQRKIVLQMAFLWEGVGAKEIAEATKMETKVISAQLKQLTDKGLVDRLETGNKNHLYRLSERFFNLWLIFTQGSPKEKRKAKCLTIFMENFYDAQEIVRIATEHLEMLQSGNPVANKAALITKALAQSRYITYIMRDKLIGNTLALQNMADELRVQLPHTSEQIFNEVDEAIKKKDFGKALRIASEVEHEDGYREFLQGYIYWVREINLEAQNYLQTAFNKDFKYCSLMLAETYKATNNLELAEKYYLIAIDQHMLNADYELGELYKRQSKWEQAESLLLKALEKGEWRAALSLGTIYSKIDKKEEAVKYSQIAINHEVIGSALQLAMFYYSQNKNKERVKELVDQERKFSQFESTPLELFAIAVDVWIGQLSNLESRIERLLEGEDWGPINSFLILMLVHHQVNLVTKLFANPTFGEKLKEENLPLYYTTLLLAEKEQNLDLKIPPELKEMVEAQVASIISMREIYQ